MARTAFVAALLGILTISPARAQAPATVELAGVVRDFKRAHPDFNVLPIGGPGHYAGNIGRDISDGDRPVFVGGGIKVGTQWTNSGSQPIPPHLFAQPMNAGEVYVAEDPDVDGSAIFDTWDSTAGAYGPGNMGPAPDFTVGAPMPALLAPSNLGPSQGDLTMNNTTINGDLHCDDLEIKNTVLIDGNVTILCEGLFRVAQNADLQILPGATLDVYTRGGVMVITHSTLNVNTGNPALVHIYNLGIDEVRISQPGATVYAIVLSPYGPMRIQPGSEFYGYFIGQTLEVQPGGGFHFDTSLVPDVKDSCGLAIDDFAGKAASFSDGGITSADTFDQWYDDQLGVNIAKSHTITLTRNGTGVYEYLEGEFYPIDHQLYGNEGDAHNFYFTYEIKADFVYESCTDQFLEFAGADDAWIFVDDKLGIDLGGIMAGTSQVLEMDRLGLTDGEMYTAHLYFAHRESTESSFELRTNIELQNDEPFVTVSLPCD